MIENEDNADSSDENPLHRDDLIHGDKKTLKQNLYQKSLIEILKVIFEENTIWNLRYWTIVWTY